ncbi:Lipid A export ATP-binding/permease protein MsbA [Candidatus Venteria ishoeyi]|uniref:Lipid A export ATP-binding/permease protein MsbA n=2 Tax=Candidatus Venteria ishoeyi TaxID=1899563 RepID=A0A1H6FFU9_9GAMM|nr:Lipid A export ATP-binding/permease protein MsbA [Candidatus Venteria ishoeyi]
MNAIFFNRNRLTPFLSLPYSISPMYFRLLASVKPYWRVFSLVLLAMVVSALTEPLLPALLQPLLDDGFVGKDPETVKMIPLWLILLALVRGGATFVSQVGLTWVAGKVVLDLREIMFARLLSLPSTEFDNASSGALLSKVTYDANRVMLATTDALVILVRDSLAITGLLAWMLYLNWQLSVIIFLIVPVIIVVVRIASKKLRRDNLSMQNAMGEVTRILEEAISGHKLVKIFGGQDYEAKRFYTASDQVRFLEVKTKVISHISIFLVQTLTALALALIIFIAASLSNQGDISVGGFVSLFTAMGMLLAPIKRLTKVNEQIQQGLAAAESIFALIDQRPEKDAGKHAVSTLSGRLQFKDLSFHYTDSDGSAMPAVLEAINLDIHPGESVALVGVSGSGKTTLANLVPRFYDLPADVSAGGASEGSGEAQLLIDGIDIRDLPLKSLRDNLALVSQDVVLFNDSIAANIAYGSMADVDREAIREAAKAAYALEFIDAMPEGLDTMIGERGVKLSGGQRQRLAIARALLKNAPILIFDEATSALDTHAEKQVQASLELLKQNRTTLIIAHRLSTIENADRIVVMEQGRIVEIGNHAQLLEKNGHYARLYAIQKVG